MATLLVDARLRIVHANAAARRMLAVSGGARLGETLGCAEGAGDCGGGERCGGCVLRRVIERAIRGERGRARVFARTHAEGGAPDLHLLAVATPFASRGKPHAVVALDDATEVVSDPRVLEVCGGCGRVAGDDGEWRRLDRFLEDRLGIEPGGPCGDCASRLGS